MRTAGWVVSAVLLTVVMGASSGSQAPASGPRIFIADSDSNRLVRIDDMTGAGWTTLGSRGAGTNQFFTPDGIFVDAAEKIYVVDTDNQWLVRIDEHDGGGLDHLR